MLPVRPLTITDVRLADGTRTSVRVAGGAIDRIGSTPEPDDDLLAGAGRLLLPAMAEAHAHLDKAFLAESVPNPSGDLMGAILAMAAAAGRITGDDIERRAERAARLMLANGATAIRTHADLNEACGLAAVAALLAVRDRLRDLVDIQVFALCGWPSVGAEGAHQRALLREAIAMGVDGVGGCPHLETDPAAGNAGFLEAAAAAGLPVDLHTDETLDPGRFALEDLADRVLASGFPFGVAASHCVSLAMQPEAVQRRVADKLAAAGISVIALPGSNLYLQGREHQTAMPRALTAVRALRAAGVNVAAGADNLQDPFNPIGRGDCLETAALMVMAAHLQPDDAFACVSSGARRALGQADSGLLVGAPAELVLVHAAGVREAVAFGPTARCVIHRGRVVAGS